ncbi:hypothetical protein C8Q74DRAFT_1219045 [Fomes fomentarius]|nr:hypothetical protein C8Q74DRAFT_1219045 [Fomes fomentarius]
MTRRLALGGFQQIHRAISHPIWRFPSPSSAALHAPFACVSACLRSSGPGSHDQHMPQFIADPQWTNVRSDGELNGYTPFFHECEIRMRVCGYRWLRSGSLSRTPAQYASTTTRRGAQNAHPETLWWGSGTLIVMSPLLQNEIVLRCGARAALDSRVASDCAAWFELSEELQIVLRLRY